MAAQPPDSNQRPYSRSSYKPEPQNSAGAAAYGGSQHSVDADVVGSNNGWGGWWQVAGALRFGSPR